MIETTLPAMLTMDQTSMAGSLLIAAILGSLLGIERSLAGKRAGMRTYALVSLGACLFVLLSTIASASLLSMFPNVDPLRIASSIIIGIGFIGSGIVAFNNNGDKHAELTTASGIWVVAGIGMACGFGLYLLAGVATVLAAAILSLFLRLENAARKRLGGQADYKI